MDGVTQASPPAGFGLGSTSGKSSQETAGQRKDTLGLFFPRFLPIWVCTLPQSQLVLRSPRGVLEPVHSGLAFFPALCLVISHQ